MAAGIYSGLTYGLREARGTHDWVSIKIFFLKKIHIISFFFSVNRADCWLLMQQTNSIGLSLIYSRFFITN